MNRHGLVMLLALAACVAAPEDPRTGEPTADSTAALVLDGEVGSEPGSEFSYVADVLRTDGGHTVVLDSRDRRILVYDSSGRFARVIGRPGEGPGEIEGPVAIGGSSDRFRVWDATLWRITDFDLAGATLGTERVMARRESGWAPSVKYVGGSHWLYLDQEIETPDDPGVQLKAGIIRGTAKLLSWNPDRGWSEVARFPGMEAALVGEGDELGLSNAPFPAKPLWAIGPDSTIWYADSRTYSVYRITMTGDTLARITVSRGGDAVTDADWNGFVGGSRKDFASPAARLRAGITRPATKPVLRDLVGSSSGDVWVQLESADSTSITEWHVYDSGGRPRFKLKLPSSFRIRHVTDTHITGDARDSLDVQTVRSYRYRGVH